MTHPCRCTDTETCLNCASAAKSAAFIRDRDHNEALYLGRRRRERVLADAAIPTKGRF